jgi:hypothetical protein
MRAKLGSEQIDDAFPTGVVLGLQSEGDQRIAGRPAIAKDPRTLLTADSYGLMPLNGAQVIGDRGGHLIETPKNIFRGTISEAYTFQTLAADTQSAVTSLRETVSHDVSIEG